jgi:hypothetical protein
MAGLDASRFIFLDETGSNTAMARRYGRAPRGQRVDGPVPHGHWKTVKDLLNGYLVRSEGYFGCRLVSFEG